MNQKKTKKGARGAPTSNRPLAQKGITTTNQRRRPSLRDVASESGFRNIARVSHSRGNADAYSLPSKASTVSARRTPAGLGQNPAWHGYNFRGPRGRSSLNRASACTRPASTGLFATPALRHRPRSLTTEATQSAWRRLPYYFAHNRLTGGNRYRTCATDLAEQGSLRKVIRDESVWAGRPEPPAVEQPSTARFAGTSSLPRRTLTRSDCNFDFVVGSHGAWAGAAGGLRARRPRCHGSHCATVGGRSSRPAAAASSSPTLSPGVV